VIRIGVVFDQAHGDVGVLRNAWQEADALGVDQIFFSDHFYPAPMDGVSDSHGPDGPYFEGMSLLAAMAESTEHAQLGLLVACNSYRNPHLLADMHRTIDHLSGGRVILGIGSGWFEKDYVEYGYEFGTVGSRLRDLARDLPIIKERLARLDPAPHSPMPILVAGVGEKVTLKIVAEHADLWNGIGDVVTLKRKMAVLDDWCAKVGRDPTEIERQAFLFGGDVALAEELTAVGFTQFVCPIPYPTDYAPVRRPVAWRDERNAVAPPAG
jgi:probable F420-dependent oxidoreductase